MNFSRDVACNVSSIGAAGLTKRSEGSMKIIPPGLKPFFLEAGHRTAKAVRFHGTEKVCFARQTFSINAYPFQVPSCSR
jgi:hypothetical protein